MKLFDKLKDLFMDEIPENEEIELEEEEKEEYKPPKEVLPKVMRDTIEKEENKKEKSELKINSVEVNKKEKEIVQQPAKKFSFPIDFEDELPSRNSVRSTNVNVLNVEKQEKMMVKSEKEVAKKVSELYPKKEEVKEKPKFKATPVISPVYGILDKNYKKEEVKEKIEDNSLMKRPSKKVDFETVRKKAFGNLADEIKDNLMCENCELYKEVKKISSLKEDDLLYDMTVDDEPEKVTIEKAYDNYEEFGVMYEPKANNNVSRTEVNESQNDKQDYEVTEEVNVLDKLENKIKDEVVLEEKEEEKIPSRQEKKKETKVDADFFELIDSMYKERIDD